MGEHDYVTRGKRFEDDSSSALGLTHDPKGRRIVALPEPQTGYDPELVGKSPEQMAEILAQREDNRDSDNLEKIMREVPGGRVPGSHSSNSKGPKKPRTGPDYTRAADPFDDKSAGVYRPHVISGRVDARARNALNAQAISPGEIFNVIGSTLADGVSWAQIEYTLNDLAAKRRIA